MTTETLTDARAGDVERYLVLVRAEMLHLPPDDYLDVLDDVEAHVHAVAEEGGQLEERLGTPKQFVDELLSSTGAPARPPRISLDLDGWIPSQLTELGPDLRRGWWVIRGAAVPLAIFGPGLAAIVFGTIGRLLLLRERSDQLRHTARHPRTADRQYLRVRRIG